MVQGWNAEKDAIGQCRTSEKGFYYPTTNKEQCIDLIINQRIECRSVIYNDKRAWQCMIYNVIDKRISRVTNINENLTIAACKAFLLSKHPNGMIEV